MLIFENRVYSIYSSFVKIIKNYIIVSIALVYGEKSFAVYLIMLQYFEHIEIDIHWLNTLQEAYYEIVFA